jgi:tRNA threonylcarbamoyladenosine biosynthesis protein TsaE
VALCGTLGAGKTRLVQAVAAAAGIRRDEVVSPTFVLCHHYHGRQTIHHLDAYRIGDLDEWTELGSDELLQNDGWVFVEWADRFADCLPQQRLTIEIEVTGEKQRLFRIRGQGSSMESVVARLPQLVQAAPE